MSAEKRELILPLRCDCGNRDDITVALPFCSADCGYRMDIDQAALENRVLLARMQLRLDNMVQLGTIPLTESQRIMRGLYEEIQRSQ